MQIGIIYHLIIKNNGWKKLPINHIPKIFKFMSLTCQNICLELQMNEQKSVKQNIENCGSHGLKTLLKMAKTRILYIFLPYILSFQYFAKWFFACSSVIPDGSLK